MSFFSIIIPTYNSEKTLQKCLESVFSQSYNDFEVLIMDGVSTDGTLEIAKLFKDSRMKIFSEKDEGIYDAMNKGIDKSKGEWLYFLGSDDELYSNDVLAKVFSIVRKTRRKIIYGNAKILGDAGWAKDGDIYDGVFNLQKILKKNICHQTVFYNTSVFQKLEKYNTDYKVCADWDFNLKCFAKYKFLFMDRIVVKFQGGNASFSKRDDIFGKDKVQNVLKYFKWHLYKREFIPYLKCQIYSTRKSISQIIVKTYTVFKNQYE